MNANLTLIRHQDTLRAEIAEWATRRSDPLVVARARRDFESAVVEALRNDTWWQHTNALELYGALDGKFLFHRVLELQP